MKIKKTINFKELREKGPASLSIKSDEVVQLKFDIVKHIIDVRLVENEAAAKARENKEKKQQLLAIIAQKKDAALQGTPLEELEAMVAQM